MGEKKTSKGRICHEVFFYIKILLSKRGLKIDNKCSWHQFALQLARPALSITPIKWNAPEGNYLKLNMDGSSNSQKNTSGIGGAVRDRNGDLIMAFAKDLHFCTNNSAEIQAALFGISWCAFTRRSDVVIELDSLIVVNMLKEIFKIPREFQPQVERMKKIIFENNYKVQHCFREGNELADSLSKYGRKSQVTAIC